MNAPAELRPIGAFAHELGIDGDERRLAQARAQLGQLGGFDDHVHRARAIHQRAADVSAAAPA